MITIYVCVNNEYINIDYTLDNNIITITHSEENIYVLREDNKSFITSEKVIKISDIVWEQNIWSSDENIELNILPTDNLCCITSVINIENTHPLIGVESRSAVSNYNRFKQTISQIISIRNKIPHSKIILLESSRYLEPEKLIELSLVCDYIILFDKDTTSLYYTHVHSTNKGLSELYGNIYISKLLLTKQFNILFKFAGRGVLTDIFDYTLHLPDLCNFKILSDINYNNPYKLLCYSNLFSIPRKYLELYYHHSLIHFFTDNHKPAEMILASFCLSLPQYNIIEELGMDWIGGPTGKLVKL